MEGRWIEVHGLAFGVFTHQRNGLVISVALCNWAGYMYDPRTVESTAPILAAYLDVSTLILVPCLGIVPVQLVEWLLASLSSSILNFAIKKLIDDHQEYLRSCSSRFLKCSVERFL